MTKNSLNIESHVFLFSCSAFPFTNIWYEGESKIIRNVDTYCAVGYTAGLTWCDTCSLLVSYCCGADVTLIVDLCHEFCVINLDDPLFVCTKEEQRAVVLFLWAEGVLGVEMHRRISVQYGNSVVSQRMVYEWIERFKNGRTSIKHEEGARRCASGSYTLYSQHGESLKSTILLQITAPTPNRITKLSGITHRHISTHISVVVNKISLVFIWTFKKISQETDLRSL
jgi:hypothetical protein